MLTLEFRENMASLGKSTGYFQGLKKLIEYDRKVRKRPFSRFTDATGIGRDRYHNMMRGFWPSVQDLVCMADYFRVPISEIMVLPSDYRSAYIEPRYTRGTAISYRNLRDILRASRPGTAFGTILSDIIPNAPTRTRLANDRNMSSKILAALCMTLRIPPDYIVTGT